MSALPRLTWRQEAGASAYIRARALGYCRTTADQLRRAAEFDARPGETAEQTAERVVADPGATAMGATP